MTINFCGFGLIERKQMFSLDKDAIDPKKWIENIAVGSNYNEHWNWDEVSGLYWK
ncbi:hypothetical protein [Fredinandcohnia quinoae]|uniref:Uncharacterized protein n=1 Tax=Fredinandcohnia quinoae TaxID=2918902 RepID=A0AAW5E0K6_9BACI|nr:hypothetical protein [Fredinandcohnia sp. SECRCQ15]MCH1626447.1 hypothetical protein [Fredinandcohnia sp. SECRCQ15]